MKKILLLVSLIAIVAVGHAQSPKGNTKPFKKIVATITRYPEEITLMKSYDSTFFYFFVTDQGLFFTDNEKFLYEVQKHIPAKVIPGNYAEIEGTTLKPFTKFPKKQLDRLSRRAGITINKETNAIRISGYSLLNTAVVQPTPSTTGWTPKPGAGGY